MSSHLPIKIFVINLPQDTHRLDNIKKQFDGYNNTPPPSYELFPAVDGRKLTTEEMENLYDHKKALKYNQNLVSGLIGCSLSHKALYQKMVNENIERAIILEDDIIIKPDFFLLIKYFNEIPVNNYVIKLERCYGNTDNDNNEKIARFTPYNKIKLTSDYYIGQPIKDVYLTWGYYIDIKAAKSLLKVMPKVFLIPDAWWFFRKYIKLRMLNKAVITIGSIPPSIDYENKLPEKKLTSIKNIINKIKKKFWFYKLITLYFK